MHAVSITTFPRTTESDVAVSANSIIKLATVLIGLPIASADRLVQIRTDTGASQVWISILENSVIVALDVCARFLNK